MSSSFQHEQLKKSQLYNELSSISSTFDQSDVYALPDFNIKRCHPDYVTHLPADGRGVAVCKRKDDKSIRVEDSLDPFTPSAQAKREFTAMKRMPNLYNTSLISDEDGEIPKNERVHSESQYDEVYMHRRIEYDGTGYQYVVQTNPNHFINNEGRRIGLMQQQQRGNEFDIHKFGK